MPASSGGGLRAGNSINLRNLQKKIDLAFKLNNLQAVILNINSPGGSPVQSSLISQYIQVGIHIRDGLMVFSEPSLLFK